MTEARGGESLVAILDELTDLVTSARAMPMSASALVNRAEVLELIESAKAVLPSQISQADTLIADADAVLDRARREAAKILEKARARAEHLVSEQAVVHAAEQRAEEAEKSRGEWAFRAGDRDALEDQRNQLAAVVEKVRAWAGEPLLQSPAGYGLNRILVAAEVAPADVLREVKAAAWDEGYSHCFDFEAEDGGVSLLDNPYRAREEAGQ